MPKKAKKHNGKGIKAKPSAQDINTTVSYNQGSCADSLRLSIQIEKDKVTKLSLKPSRSSCDQLKKASTLLEKHVIGRHIGDIYSLNEESLGDSEPHHSSTLVIHALRQAILDYESKKATASLQEALHLLQGYEEGYSPRDASDYEM